MPPNAIRFDMPRFSNSYSFTSICFVFPSKRQSILFDLRRSVHFKISSKKLFKSKLECWLTKSGKNAFGIELSWYSNLSSWTTDLNSWMEVWIDGDTFLVVSYREQSLILSLQLESWWFQSAKGSIWHSYFVDPKTHNSLSLLAWILPTMSPSRLSCQ